MGTTLTGQTQSSTYDALLKITDNGPVGGTAKVITDGLGNDSALKLGTAGAEITGVLVLAAGAVGAPSSYLSTDTTTGWYRIGANNLGLAISGVKLLDLSAALLGITGGLNVSGTAQAATLTLTNALGLAYGGTGGTTAATARTGIGIGIDTDTNSSLAGSAGVNQTGGAGADLVFSAANAPTVSLTAGRWLVYGSVRVRASGAATSIWAQFWNNTDSAAFGGSASNYTTTTISDEITCHGVYTVASGTKVIYFKLFNGNEAAGSIIAGNDTEADGPAGYIVAVKLTA